MPKARKKTAIHPSPDSPAPPPSETDQPIGPDGHAAVAHAESDALVQSTEAPSLGRSAPGADLQAAGTEPEAPPHRPTRATLVTDRVAGLRLHMDYLRQQAAISLDEDRRPTEEEKAILRDGGFRWIPSERAWEKPVHFASRLQDRMEAERVFDSLAAGRREPGAQR